jgi:nitrogen PTS system EIIA component
MKLASLLPVDAVLPGFSARDKKQALKLLSARAARDSGISEKEIYSTLMEREGAGCTGMGGGVCIPHGRFEGLDRPRAYFARLAEPIDFGSSDGLPVDLIFLLLTPARDNTGHLKALALISGLLRDKELCQELRTSRDAVSIHALMVASCEEQ